MKFQKSREMKLSGNLLRNNNQAIYREILILITILLNTIYINMSSEKDNPLCNLQSI